MADLLTRAQLRILAQLLDADPEAIAGLARLGADAIRTLSTAISDALFDADEATFGRLARLAPLVPDALVTKVAVAAVPPEVAGRAGGSLGLAHPGRVAGILSAMPAPYLADAAPHLDPRTISALTPRMRGEFLVPPANELMRRGDHLTAARFVEHATDALLDAFEQGIADDIGLLRTAALIPDTDRLRAVIDRFPAARRESVARSMTTDTDDTLTAGLSVLARLAAPERTRLTTAVLDSLDESGLNRLISAAGAGEATAELLLCLDGLTESLRLRVGTSVAAVTGNPEHATDLLAIQQGLAEVRSLVRDH
ncbi:hypothetical protein ACWEVD_28630 [Nocardia thailandica]